VLKTAVRRLLGAFDVAAEVRAGGSHAETSGAVGRSTNAEARRPDGAAGAVASPFRVRTDRRSVRARGGSVPRCSPSRGDPEEVAVGCATCAVDA